MLYATSFALMFIGYPVLSSALGALDAYSRVFSIVYRAFVVFSSLALIRLAVTRVGAEAWRGPLSIAFCALWAMLLLRFVWDSSFVPIPLPLPWWDHFLMMVGAVLIPAVGLYHAPSERAFDIARRIILCGGVLAGVFLVAAVLRIVFETDSIAQLRRLGTDELNPISLGNLSVAVVTVALLGQPLPRPSSLVARIMDSRGFRITAGSLGGLLAIASASKGPIVALVGVIVVSQVARILRTGSAREVLFVAVRLSFVAAGLVALAIVLGLFLNVRVVDRFLDFTIDSSTSDRVGMMTRALLQFETSPWLGSAYVETQARFYPHNLFVEVLMAIGVPGLCALLVLLVIAFRAAMRVVYSRHDWVVLLFAQYQIGIMFTGSLYFSTEFWVSMAGILALDRMLARQRRPEPETISPGLAIGGRA